MSMSMLDWAEQYGHENMRERMRNTETLAREAHTTMTLLMAAIGAATAYVIRNLESGALSEVGIGVAATLIWLMLTAAILLWKCQMTRDLHIGPNEPKNLYVTLYDFEELRTAELDGLQRRIDRNRARNQKTARWLNVTRTLILLTPIVFGVTWALVSVCQ